MYNNNSLPAVVAGPSTVGAFDSPVGPGAGGAAVDKTRYTSSNWIIPIG